MADISDIDAAQSVKVIGATSDGTESSPVMSNPNGKIMSADISDNGGVQASLTVGTGAVEVKVGGSALANRVEASVYNNSTSTIYYGYTSGVTTLTGTPISKKQHATFKVGPDTSIYLISGSSGNDVRITEIA